MRRKQRWKKLFSTLMIGAMLCTEVPVMASDFADGADVNVTQEVAENVGQEETDGEASDVAVENGAITDPEDAEVDFSDEEDTDVPEVAVDQENSEEADVVIDSEETAGEIGAEDFADSEESSAVEVGQDEDNLLGGGTVVEASTADWKYIYNKLGAALTEYCGNETSVTIPKTVGGNNVIACKKDLLKDKADVITSVTIEAELTSLPDGFFSNFSQLETVSLPDTITDLGENTFYWCRELQTVKLPKNLTKIGNSTFSYCGSLEELRIPDKVVQIDGDAFWNCSSLKKIYLPKNLKLIGSDAFYGCGSLKEITVPDGTERIGFRAFGCCAALEEVVLPDSVKTIYNEEHGYVESYGIGTDIFYGCSSLKSVKLPKDLEVIKDSMFEGCSSLKTIELPAGITKIESEAFKDCSSLSKLKLSDKVTEIGSSAFKDCTQLVSAYIPGSVQKIGENAFTGCSLLTIYGTENSYAQKYAEENGLQFATGEMPDTEFSEESAGKWMILTDGNNAIITAYTGTETALTIPKILNGRKVIACKKDLLKDKADVITSVTIEAELTSLPDGFFSNFSQLETVSLPDTIKNLGANTFYWCRELQTVKLPKNLTKIGNSTFSYCGSLEELRIPDKVVQIDGDAFWNCSSLKKIYLPKNLKLIGSDAFYGCGSLKEITVPDGTERIGFRAFGCCAALEEVVLPDSVKTIYNEEHGYVESYGIGTDIFYGCSSLKSIKLPKDLEVIKDSMFEGCSSLKTIKLPAGITKIESEAFKDCSSLSKLKLSDKVTEIGSSAFKDCIQLVSAYIPGSVQKIGENAFTGCSLLTIYGTENSYAQKYAEENGLQFATGEMPDTEFSEESAGKWMILTDGNNAIITAYTGTETALTIPKILNGRKVIACKKDLLKDKADVITSVTIEAELTSLPDGFFSNFSQLETVSLPDTIKNLGANTFYWCRELQTVKLPKNLTKIGNSTFSYCGSLEELRIPDKVVQIDGDAFWNCSSLKKIYLPKNLKLIGSDAFYGCGSLKEITVPDGTERIGFRAFGCCAALEEVVLPDSVKTIYNEEHGYVESYGIGTDIFYGCSSLKSVKLPKDLEVIKDSMFEGCTSLKTIELPAGITKIEQEAFKDCSSLSKIKLSDKITEIGNNAFKDCLVLTNLSVYSALKTIGDNAFIGDPFLVLSCINNPDAANYAKNNKILYTTVEIESSGKNYSTKIPKDTFSQIQEGQKLTIDAGDVNMEFDAAAVSAIKNASANSDVTLALKDVDKGKTGNPKQDTVIDRFIDNAGKVLDLSLKDSTNKDVKFSNNNAGMFTITLPYTAPAGNNPAVYCIEKDGNMEEMQSSYSASAHMITFETPHFSVFAIGDVTKQNHVHRGTEISKKATCTSAGQKAYYSCSCGKIFWDKECTREITNKNDLKNLTIPALGHNMVLAAAKVKATNTANGSEEKYRCSRCGMTQGGQNIARIARVTLYKGVNKTYNLTPGKWKLTKTKAATLKKNRLTVKKTGTVKVKDQITKQTVTIRIVNPTMSVNKKKITIKAKKKYQLKVKTVPVQKVKYSTSNKKIATVSATGVIQAKKKGTVTITIKCGSLKKTCKVTVK